MGGGGETIEFASRRDVWLMAVLLGAVGAELFAVGNLLLGGTHGLPWAARLGLAALLLAAAGVILWTVLDTRYLVAGDVLLVRCGPFRWRIPVSAVRSMTPVWSLWSAPALSGRRLALQVAGRGTMEISPGDREGFAAALSRAAGRPIPGA